MAGRKKKKGKIKIAPSILSADFAVLGEEVKRAEKAGGDSIHVDVMDGRFVPNITIGPMVVERVRASTSLPIDVHLMIVEPEKYIEDFAGAGADMIYVHQEACRHLHRVIWKIRDLGKRPAVALNPATAAATLEDILPDIDRILIMTVNPGFGGQRFISTMLPKIKGTKEIVEAGAFSIEIEVDGGISPLTAPQVVKAGATHLVAGNSLFRAGNFKAAMEKLRRAAEVE